MKHNISTTPEQSQRLIACGVDPKSADMFMGVLNDGTPFLVVDDKEDTETDSPQLEGTPTWSLSALLALLPKIIICDAYGYIWLEIVWLYEENSIPTIRYFTPPNENDDESDQWEFTDESIIECAVQAVEWINENGYKLNEIE